MDILHVKTDNLNDFLVEFCFIRSIDTLVIHFYKSVEQNILPFYCLLSFLLTNGETR
jgi:hypothetical protein